MFFCRTCVYECVCILQSMSVYFWVWMCVSEYGVTQIKWSMRGLGDRVPDRERDGEGRPYRRIYAYSGLVVAAIWPGSTVVWRGSRWRYERIVGDGLPDIRPVTPQSPRTLVPTPFSDTCYPITPLAHVSHPSTHPMTRYIRSNRHDLSVSDLHSSWIWHPSSKLPSNDLRTSAMTVQTGSGTRTYRGNWRLDVSTRFRVSFPLSRFHRIQ